MPAQCANLKSSDSSFSPTPTTDSTAKRLSWSKLMQKLTDFSGSSVNHSMDSDSDSCSRSECSESEPALLLSDVSSCDECDLFYDPVEETLCKELLEHIGQELLHLAASEPCGLRGALIDLCVEQQDVCQSVEQIAVDPYLVPTFQLTLVLRLDCGGLWPKIQGLFSAKSPSTPTVRHALRLSTGFRVIKKKLYSSEELLIEEC
ncbi:DNA damage-inducible transcript 4 protein isoform X2 [Paramormyrops kingsleyae]|uniref:DNA damage-inducible transcript 4 protein isoform X2 n=1 Tax=Paramormyrops kingsleyae TaxID=1676925 RepID=UPI003B97BE77